MQKYSNIVDYSNDSKIDQWSKKNNERGVTEDKSKKKTESSSDSNRKLNLDNFFKEYIERYQDKSRKFKDYYEIRSQTDHIMKQNSFDKKEFGNANNILGLKYKKKFYLEP